MRSAIRASLCLPPLLMLPVASSHALEVYIPGQIYVGGDEVCHGGDRFRAKWWAGPADHPNAVDQVANPWETPWERTRADDAACGTADSGNAPPVAVIVADPIEIRDAGVVQLSALASRDPDGDELTYLWRQVTPADATAVFEEPSAAETAVSLSEAAETTGYVFEVEVSDGELSDFAQVSVIQRVTGDDSFACPNWDSGTIYEGGDLVVYADGRWEAQWWTRGEEPGTTGQWGVWRAAPADALCSIEDGGNDDPGDEGDTDPDPGDGNPTRVRLSDLRAAEQALTNTPLMVAVKASIATRDNAVVNAIVPGNPDNPGNVRRVERIVSAADWDWLFPRRAPEYTYTNFLKGGREVSCVLRRLCRWT